MEIVIIIVMVTGIVAETVNAMGKGTAIVTEISHSDSRNGEGNHRDREGRSERDGGERSGTHKESFAVPDPPRRKKSRWDN